MDKEAMQQALEALELLAKWENPLTKWQVRKPKDGGPIVTIYPHKVATDAATLLRERLAQPEQEQVECMCGVCKLGKRQWVSLTDQEVWEAIEDVLEGGGWLDVARVLEVKIKEKNHG